jgi:predicted O-methyltransferase YrrM
LVHNKNVLSTGGGIAPIEVYLLESLSHVYSPKNIFIIGNAFGWSTIVMALAFKNANIVALDAGIEGNDNLFGINLTNKIAQEQGFNCHVEFGFSPEKTGEVIKNRFGKEKLDLVFIDGLHTNDQLLKDFDGVRDYCSNHTIYLFHDVINWEMTAAFERIKQCLSLYDSKILYRTASGMGACVPQSSDSAIIAAFNAFTEDEQIIANTKMMQTRLWKIKNIVYRFMPSVVRKFVKKIRHRGRA